MCCYVYVISALVKSAVKEGTIAVEEKIVVAWRKSKRTFNAKVIDEGDDWSLLCRDP